MSNDRATTATEGIAITVMAECPSCNGTGLYAGFKEPKDVGVVCTNCNGEGKKKLVYTPFTVRKRRDHVKRVCVSHGVFSNRPYGAEEGVSYEEFLAGKFPG